MHSLLLFWDLSLSVSVLSIAVIQYKSCLGLTLAYES